MLSTMEILVYLVSIANFDWQRLFKVSGRDLSHLCHLAHYNGRCQEVKLASSAS